MRERERERERESERGKKRAEKGVLEIMGIPVRIWGRQRGFQIQLLRIKILAGEKRGGSHGQQREKREREERVGKIKAARESERERA